MFDKIANKMNDVVGEQMAGKLLVGTGKYNHAPKSCTFGKASSRLLARSKYAFFLGEDVTLSSMSLKGKQPTDKS